MMFEINFKDGHSETFEVNGCDVNGEANVVVLKNNDKIVMFLNWTEIISIREVADE